MFKEMYLVPKTGFPGNSSHNIHTTGSSVNVFQNVTSGPKKSFEKLELSPTTDIPKMPSYFPNQKKDSFQKSNVRIENNDDPVNDNKVVTTAPPVVKTPTFQRNKQPMQQQLITPVQREMSRILTVRPNATVDPNIVTTITSELENKTANWDVKLDSLEKQLSAQTAKKIDSLQSDFTLLQDKMLSEYKNGISQINKSLQTVSHRDVNLKDMLATLMRDNFIEIKDGILNQIDIINSQMKTIKSEINSQRNENHADKQTILHSLNTQHVEVVSDLKKLYTGISNQHHNFFEPLATAFFDKLTQLEGPHHKAILQTINDQTKQTVQQLQHELQSTLSNQGRKLIYGISDDARNIQAKTIATLESMSQKRLETFLDKVDQIVKQKAITASEPALPATRPEPSLPVTEPEQPLPVTGPEQPLPVTGPEQPLPVTGPEQPLPVTGPEQPLPVTGPEQPLPITSREQPLPVTGPEQPLPITGREQPLPVTGPKPPLPVTGPQQPLPITGPAEPLAIEDHSSTSRSNEKSKKRKLVKDDDDDRDKTTYNKYDFTPSGSNWVSRSDGKRIRVNDRTIAEGIDFVDRPTGNERNRHRYFTESQIRRETRLQRRNRLQRIVQKKRY